MPTDDLEQPGHHAKRAHVDDNDDGIGFVYPKRQRTSTENVKHGWWREPEQIKLSHADYTVGWICALPIELAASHAMLDRIHESLPTIDNDTNAYILGSIGDHNIAMACLPFGQYGTINAATVAGNMMRSFGSIRFGFMVGIGGGVPGDPDVRLGDIVVGTHVIQHDLGKIVAGDGFQGTATPKAPPQVLLTAISKLRAFHETNESQVSMFLQEMQQRYPRLAEYTYPSSCEDRLFLAAYDHGQSGDCSSCSRSQIHHRPSRSGKHPRIHYGGIASGDQVIKSARHRDELARKHNIICYEMEAAGLSDNLSSIVIRGICDYADSHKNKEWQRYAAATAAAYAKELLSTIAPSSSHGLSDNYSSPLPPDIPCETLHARREALLESIRFEQIDARHATIKSAHSKTCDWLIQDPLYDRWLDQSRVAEHRGFFWISGKPGAGKSTIMKFAYNRAKQASKSDDAIISFFFNARGDELEKSTLGLYRSLLLQLLERFSDLQTVLDNTALIPLRETGCPNSDALQELLRSAIISLGQRRLTCFVDALDECDESQVRDMVVYFEDLGEDAVANGTRLRICFSSRHYPHIDVRHGLRLVLEDQPGHGQDLERYVRSHLRAGKGKIVDDIRSKVLRNSGGVFMWVVLVCKILNEEFVRGRKAISRVEQRLREIPPGLSDLFKDILTRDNANMEDLLICIQWVLFAKRPLTLKEFYFAMLSGLPELQEVPTVYDPETDTDEEMRIFVTGSSKGLAEITKSKKGTVQFIHESVKDFLVKDGGFRELWPDLDDNFEVSGHEKLKQCCCSHITADVSRQIQVPNVDNLFKANSEDAKKLRQDATEKFPFLEYATENIFHHANFAAQQVSQEAFLHEVPLAEWIRLNNMLEKYQTRRYTPKASLTYILAEKNFCTLLEEHTRHAGDIHMKGERYGFPLFAALANGYKLAAQALLGVGAKSISIDELFPGLDSSPSPTRETYELAGKYQPHPLHWAISEMQWTVAGLIVDSGYFDCSIRNAADQSCIHLASKAGNSVFMERLLEKAGSRSKQIALVNLRDVRGRTPLWFACSGMNEAIIRQLLKWGAQLSMVQPLFLEFDDPATFRLPLVKVFNEARLVPNGRLLEAAVNFGLEDVVKYILNGNEITGMTSSSVSLLEKAAKFNWDRILRLLLENGPPFGQSKWNSHDIVIRACSENDKDAVRYFIENGADMVALFCRVPVSGNEALVKRLLDNNIRTTVEERFLREALENLAKEGQAAKIKMLIENSTGVINRNDFLTRVLYEAARRRHTVVIEILIANCIGTIPEESFRSNALEILLEGGYEAAVEMLIENSWDITGRHDFLSKALQIAADRDHAAIVNTHINNGMSTVYKESFLNTVLKATARGHEADVNMILERGRSIAHRDDFLISVLSKAAIGGHNAIFKMLLDDCSTNTYERSFFNKALFSAVEGGQTAAVRVAVTKGADVNALHSDFCTPLHRASSLGHKTAIEFLLEHGAEVHLQDRSGQTALHLASAAGYHDVAQSLLAHGANANLQNLGGQTALHKASAIGGNAVVKILLAHKANINLQDRCGLTALHEASTNGHNIVVEILLAHGADVGLQDSAGQTAVQRASNSSRWVAVNLLKSHRLASVSLS